MTREVNSGSLSLPFAGLEDAENSLGLTETGTVESVRIKLYANHSKPSNLSVELVSPAGTRSVLLTPLNGYQRWDTSEYIEFSSNAFYGESIKGDWKLILKDHFAGDGGVLKRWSLRIYGH